MARAFRQSLVATVLVAAFVIAARPASATTMVVDFGTTSWQPANLQAAYSAPGSGVTATALPPLLDAQLSWTPGAGLGVDGLLPLIIDWNPDEINQLEMIQLSFGGPVLLNSFTVSKLFYQELALYNETGYYSLDGVTWTPFQQNTNDPAGLFTVNVNDYTSLLYLGVHYDNLLVNAFDVFNDFSVKEVSYDSIPDAASTASMLLLGLGIMWVGKRHASCW
jgi:hypothetical protein